MSKSSASTHTGWSTLSSESCNLRRNGGIAVIRRRSSDRRASKEYPPSIPETSRTISPHTCRSWDLVSK